MSIRLLRRAPCLAPVLLAIMLLAGTSGAARAETPQDFYRGKTVHFIVGTGPGGGYDLYARMLAPHLASQLGASVVVEDQPGAGGLTALDRLYVAPPDGLQIMIVNGALSAMAQLLGQSAVRYDLAKVSHLGTVNTSPGLWLVAPDSPVKTPEDLLRAHARIRWGATGPTDGLFVGATITCAALRLDCQIVLGYEASSNVALAVLHGEMDSMYVTDSTAANYVRSGQGRALALMGRQRSRLFPDVPTIFESAALDDEQQWWVDFNAGLEALGRILAAPPGMTAERLAFLRDAVHRLLTDPGLIQEGEKTQRPIEYHAPVETQATAEKTVTSLTPVQRQRVKQVMERQN